MKALFDALYTGPEEKRPAWENQTAAMQAVFAKGYLNHPAGRCYRVRPDGTAYSFAMMVSPEKFGLREYRTPLPKAPASSKAGPRVCPDPDHSPKPPVIPEGFRRIYVYGFDIVEVDGHPMETNRASRCYLVPAKNPRSDHEIAVKKFRDDYPRQRTGWRPVADHEGILHPEETLAGA